MGQWASPISALTSLGGGTAQNGSRAGSESGGPAPTPEGAGRPPSASGDDAGGSAPETDGPQPNGLPLAALLGASGPALGSGGGGAGDFLGAAASPEGGSLLETTQKLKQFLSEVGGGSQEDTGEIDFLLPEEAVYAAADAAAAPAGEPLPSGETPAEGAAPAAQAENLPSGEPAGELSPEDLQAGDVSPAGAGPLGDPAMLDAAGEGADAAPQTADSGSSGDHEMRDAIDGVPEEAPPADAGPPEDQEMPDAAGEGAGVVPAEEVHSELEPTGLPEAVPEAPVGVTVPEAVAEPGKGRPEGDSEALEAGMVNGPVEGSPEAPAADTASGQLAPEVAEVAPPNLGGLAVEEGPGVIPEGGLEGLDTEAASAPKAAASDGALPVKEELDVSPGGSPPSVPDAEPAAAAAAAAPEVAPASPPRRSPEGSSEPGGSSAPSAPPSEDQQTPGAGVTPEAGAMVEGSTGKGAGRPPKSGLKKSRLGPASGTGTEVKRGVGRPARVILGPDGTPLPKSHKKKVDPGSEGTKSKPKPPPPPPRQLTRLRPPSGEAAKAGMPDTAAGKGGLAGVGTPGAATSVAVALATPAEPPRPPMDPKLALMERLGGVLAAPGKFWVHESKLPLWLVKIYEEKTRQMAAIEAARKAREAYRISAGTPCLLFPSACGYGYIVCIVSIHSPHHAKFSARLATG